MSGNLATCSHNSVSLIDTEFERAWVELHLIGRWGAQAYWFLELAGGEPRRIGVARVLLSHPDFLFLDEATKQVLYALVRERLPTTAGISVDQRQRLTLHLRHQGFRLLMSQPSLRASARPGAGRPLA